MAIKATINRANTAALKSRISQNDTLQATAVSIGSAGRLSELSDLDVSALEQGAMLVYDEVTGKWIAKKELEDGTALNGGRY